MSKIEEYWPDWKNEISSCRAQSRQAMVDAADCPVSRGDMTVTILRNQQTILKALFWLLRAEEVKGE